MKLDPEQIPSLIGQVIVFNSKTDYEIDFDDGMKARVVNIIPDDQCHRVFVNFSEFEEYNCNLMLPNYYDSNGQPTEKWCAQSHYPKDGKTDFWVSFVDDRDHKTLVELPFDLTVDRFPTVQECLDALERTLDALRLRNLGKPYKCLDEVFAEANQVLKRGGRNEI